MDLNLIRARARGHGVVARSDLVPEVLTASAWARAHRNGLLAPVHRAVSRLVDVPQRQEQAILAAVVACGDGALAAGPSAALLWGAETQAVEPVHVIVPVRTRHPEHSGVVAHRPTDLADLRASTRAGIPTSNPLRAVLDTAAWQPSSTQSAVEQLVVHGYFGLHALRSVLDRHARSGRPGIVELRRVLDEWTLGERPPDSVLEARMGALCVAHGLPPFLFQQPVGRFRPDFLWPDELVIAECDGWDAHGSRRRKVEDDHSRDAILQAAGYVVNRFTWTQITRTPAMVARRLREGLETRRRQLRLGA